MDLAEITAKIAEQVANSSGLGSKLKFVMPEAGAVMIDNDSVNNDDGDADCTITIAQDDMSALLSGDLNPTAAFMQGKLKVEGDMGIAMKLQSVLG